ncbi:hypothetical protein [Frankia sp. AgKG'84/4]|nr:hypothetical protein [Frankia sp. AgKG'84/4]MCL9793490.1 hypothetical protein [Frankia sp. AgKG'84/4]
MSGRRPKARNLATTDARLFALVARLPAALRVRLLRAQRGLRNVPPVVHG